MTAPTKRRPAQSAADSIPRLPSNQAMISDVSVQGAIVHDAIESVSMNLQRAAMYTGEIERNFRSILSQTKAAHGVAKDMAHQIQQAAKAQPGAAAAAPAAGPGAVPPGLRRTDVGNRAQPPATGDVTGRPVRHLPSQQDLRGPWSEQPGLGDMTYEQGRQAATLGGLRQGAANRLNRFLSDRTPHEPWSVDAQGRAHYLPGHNRAGQFVSREDIESYSRRINRVATVQRAVNAVGGGEGLAGAAGALGRFAGPVGIAIGVAQGVGKIEGAYLDQREKNRTYQQIYGGSNASGYSQRLQEAAFARVSMFGTMGGQQARELFQGVSQLGLQGGEREDALSFAVRNFRKTGMDISTSIELMSTALRNGSRNFEDLNGSLDQVATAAKNAGINVGEAQKAFAATYQMVQSNITTGGSAARVAGALAATDTAFTNTAPGGLSIRQLAASENVRRLSASALGISQQSFGNQVAAGGAQGNALLGRGLNAFLDTTAKQALGRQGQAGIQQIRQELGMTGPNLSETDIAEISQVAQQRNLFNNDRITAVFAARGQQIDPAKAGQIAVTAAVGGYQQEIANQFGLGGSGNFNPNQVGGQTITGKGQRGALDKALGFNRGGHHWGWMGGNPWKKNQDEGVDAYESEVFKSGQRNQGVETLLKQGSHDASQVKVRVGDTTKWVSFAEALSNPDYYKQVVGGTAQVRDAGGKAELITDRVDRLREEAANKKRKGKDGEKGVIEVYPTAYLSQILGFRVYGGEDAARARDAGVPASAFPTGSLPSSTGTP